MRPIFHLALPDDWHAARRVGRYEISTRGRTLADEGFVHCSFEHQVAGTAQRFYADVDGLVLLTVDPDLLGAPVIVETAVAGGEEFPHVYGPIPIDAVVSFEPYSPPA